MIERLKNEIKVLKYFRTFVKGYKDDFKQCYKSLKPIEKFKVYTFIEHRDKRLANEISNLIMSNNVISFKIGG